MKSIVSFEWASQLLLRLRLELSYDSLQIGTQHVDYYSGAEDKCAQFPSYEDKRASSSRILFNTVILRKTNLRRLRLKFVNDRKNFSRYFDCSCFDQNFNNLVLCCLLVFVLNVNIFDDCKNA